MGEREWGGVAGGGVSLSKGRCAAAHIDDADESHLGEVSVAHWTGRDDQVGLRRAKPGVYAQVLFHGGCAV